MRRRKLPPDNRFDWRDASMPVLRSRVKDGRVISIEIPDNFIRMHSNNQIANGSEPDYWYDPSYNWNRKRR